MGARERLPEWDERTCSGAAKGGHATEVLKWARENGCPWDEDTCAYAAEGGHLEVLKWARANGCPSDARTCAYAAEGGHRGAEVGARERPPVGRGDVCGAAGAATSRCCSGRAENDCPWDEATLMCCEVVARERCQRRAAVRRRAATSRC